jgi:asparagine synthase (glutamine-hydrolysing)
MLPESTSYHGFVRRARRFMEHAPLPLAQRYLGWVGIFHPGLLQDLCVEELKVDPLGHFATYFEPVASKDPIEQLLSVNARTYLPGDLLVKTDRMTMANSVEARCPFLDQDLWEFAAKIPTALKLKGSTTKYILKRAVDGLVPREIIHRKKHGFGVPIGHWFRSSLKDYVRDVLLSPQALHREYFRENALRQLLEEHQTGKRDHGQRLWALLTFETWHRIFIDQQGAA